MKPKGGTSSPGTSSPDEIAVFQAYVDLINSERETLWARHNALLLANSLIIGALAISPTALWEKEWAALAMIAAGLVVSATWAGLSILAWSSISATPSWPGLSRQTASSTCPIPSPKPSQAARRRACISSSC